MSLEWFLLYSWGATVTFFQLLGRVDSEMAGGRAGARARAPLHGPIGRRHAHDSRSRARRRQNGTRIRAKAGAPGVQRVPQDELRWQRFHTDAAGWSTRTLTGLLPRALPLNKRCFVVDTVIPTATWTPPRVPIRTLAAPCKGGSLLDGVARKWHVARSSRRSRVESYETSIVA